jgi:hypothetical protein
MSEREAAGCVYAPNVSVIGLSTTAPKEMVDLTMALFAKFWVNGNQDELLSLLD